MPPYKFPKVLWLQLALGCLATLSACAQTDTPEQVAGPAPDILAEHWSLYGPASVDEKVVREETGAYPSIKIERQAGEQDPECLSVAITLPEDQDAWMLSGWLKLKGLYFQDPGFFAGLSYQWLNENDQIIGSEWNEAFSSYTIQRKYDLSTKSGSSLAFDWKYDECLIQRPKGAKALRLRFRFAKADGEAWLTDVSIRPATPLDLAAEVSSKIQGKAPELRLRDGKMSLREESPENIPIFLPDEPIQLTAYPPEGNWDTLQARLVDQDGGLVWSTEQPVKDKEGVLLSVPLEASAECIGEPLDFIVSYTGEGTRSKNGELAIGILPERAPLSDEARKASNFGVVAAPSSVYARGRTMMKRIGIQWIRYRMARWYQKDPDVPQDIRATQYIDQMLSFPETEFCQLINTAVTHSGPSWAEEPGIFHRGNEAHLKDEEFAKWITLVGESLPEFTQFKLFNERDRDSDPAYLKEYAELIKYGYKALKKARPDATIYVEGGFTPEIVKHLLDYGMYDYMDVVDHHLYGTYPLVLGLQERLDLMYEAGYDIPVISSEIGVVPGAGSPTVDDREIARGMMRNIACWLAIGGTQFYPFVWGTHGPYFDQVFHNLYFVSMPSFEPLPVYFVYAQLSRLLEGAERIGGPSTEDGLLRMSFTRDDQRIDIVWAEKGQATGRWISDEPITLIEAMGRQTTIQPASTGVIIEVGESPVIVVGPKNMDVSNEKPLLKPSQITSVAQEAGGALTLPSLYVNNIQQLPEPLLPRGWSLNSDPKTPNSWEVKAAPQTPTGSYTLRWNWQNEKGQTEAIAFTSIAVVPDLSVEVVAKPGKERNEVTIKLDNKGSLPWSGKIEVISPADARIQPQLGLWEFTIPANTTEYIPWKLEKPIPWNSDKDPVFDVLILPDGGNLEKIQSRTTFKQVNRLPNPVKADGFLEDWEGADWMEIPVDKFVGVTAGRKNGLRPTDNQDLSAKVAIAYHQYWLAIAVEVTDDVFWNENDAKEIWAGDAIEIGIGVRKKGKQTPPDDYYKIALGLSPDGPVAYGFHTPPGMKWARGNVTHTDYFVRRTDDGRTIYEIVFSFGALRLNYGDGLSFAVAVDEADELGIREGFLQFYDGVVNNTGPTPLGWFTLEE